MKLVLDELTVACHTYQEIVPFARFTYFYGKMGAGKSSIARLVDYCLGGKLALTPALQSEFRSATLTLRIAGSPVTIERARNVNQMRVQWKKEEDLVDIVVPARTPSGEVVPGTGIEILSDVFFYLAGSTPPKVRRSKLRDDSDLERLSLRDLLWYCYLDQDTIDSEFFHLDSAADAFKRNKSRDVLRFVIGFHQERVAELEAQLERLRSDRTRMEVGAEALRQALSDANFSTQSELDIQLHRIRAEQAEIEQKIVAVRADVENFRSPDTGDLRAQGRSLAMELDIAEEAISTMRQVIADDRRHLNELLTLSTKFRRMTSARAVLNDVEFVICPRCARTLPKRSEDDCNVCGQADSVSVIDENDSEATRRDIEARSAELKHAIAERESRLASLRRRSTAVQEQKALVDSELMSASRNYDSAYLARAIELEHAKARLEGEFRQLVRLRALPQRVEECLRFAEQIGEKESEVRRELRAAREAAERDTANLGELERFFLDCLVRSRIPGFSRDDVVRIGSPWFLPEVSNAREEGMIMTSFSNLGSGGKKTLFKCCFALAIHRLAAKIGATLPTLLIIDSPMKNISERENREQFEGFHELLYELATGELAGTQFIVIDKEFFPPTRGEDVDVRARYMTPDGEHDGPLLKGYRGH